MDTQYEPSNPLSMPFDCFEYDSEKDAFPIREHWHYFSELLMAEEGTLLVQQGDTLHRVTPGEILFVNPQNHHSIDSLNGEHVRYLVIKLDLNQLSEIPSYAPDLRTMMLEAERLRIPMHLSAKDVSGYHMDFMVRQCVQECTEQQYAYDLKVRALLYLIATALVRILIRDGFSAEPGTTKADPLYSITHYVDQHIRENLKVEELARYCGLSYPWFARRFREMYGIGCKEYIEKVRISKVEHYLLFTDYDLRYISRETGYADCSHMIKDFRRLMGTTPGQFRQERKKI